MREIGYLAGGIMKTYFTHFGMERVVKTDTTPLTKADTEINDMVIEHVRRIAPEIDIIGEERSARLNSPWQIVCDPVDGTFPYSWGMPVATFMLGVLYKHQPMAGVIYDPFTDRMYSAEVGKGAWMNDKKLRVSKVSKKEDRPIVGYVSWPGCPFNVIGACAFLESRGVTLVNICSIGYLEVAVANGEFAGTIFPGTAYHDTAPGHVIVEEAGGLVTDILGNPLKYEDGKIQGHIMSNGRIHELLVSGMRIAQSHTR